MSEDTRTRVLVVEDEVYLADVLRTGLRFVGFEVHTVHSGIDALAEVSIFRPHLVLLDVMLPDVDGFTLCAQIRDAASGIGIVFLTARDATEDKITGLELGGDDYITKPFSLDEVVARMRSVLRRTGLPETAADDSGLSYADLELDVAAHQCRRGGELIELSPTEFALLRHLMVNSGRVVSKQSILENVWNHGFVGDGSIVETYISYLRKKIDAGARPRLIQTIRGVGYTLRSAR